MKRLHKYPLTTVKSLAWNLIDWGKVNDSERGILWPRIQKEVARYRMVVEPRKSNLFILKGRKRERTATHKAIWVELTIDELNEVCRHVLYVVDYYYGGNNETKRCASCICEDAFPPRCVRIPERGIKYDLDRFSKP